MGGETAPLWKAPASPGHDFEHMCARGRFRPWEKRWTPRTDICRIDSCSREAWQVSVDRESTRPGVSVALFRLPETVVLQEPRAEPCGGPWEGVLGRAAGAKAPRREQPGAE